MKPAPAPRQVLVVATRQIGDVLLTTPLIRAARGLWPQARIDVLGFKGTLGMLRGNPDVAELIETPARLGLRGGLAFVRRLWRRYDLALVTDAGDRAHLMAWIAARRRSGLLPQGHGSDWWKRALLDHVVLAAGDRGDRHVVAEKLDLIAPWLPSQAGAPTVVPPAGAPLPGDIAAAVQAGCVIVHAPSMWAYKQWPLPHYEQLIRELLAQGRQVVLTGSASERDQQCIAPLRGLAPAPQLLDVSGRLDFNQLAGLMQDACLYIGPDTSVSHLAAATGVPVIAIFGPTNPVRWGPWPTGVDAGEGYERAVPLQRLGNVILMQSSLSCVPCGRAGCEDHRQSRSDCLIDITPERVLAQAQRILDERGGTKRCARLAP
ncbi:glycosyltransferase family 9 protein [Ramlibacter solisilvae]|uniref:glycosyltransferase family 9 protein n=1 Tax=Ramlibacter tataouinensis TaxID=94132 RepID=UPI0007775E70|nr:glycosyltransferase family 9 protein [Ramlibacter tataouinensis]